MVITTLLPQYTKDDDFENLDQEEEAKEKIEKRLNEKDLISNKNWKFKLRTKHEIRITNIPENTTTDDIKEKIGNLGKIDNPKKSIRLLKSYKYAFKHAFVDIVSYKDAQNIIDKLNGVEWHGEEIQIKLADLKFYDKIKSLKEIKEQNSLSMEKKESSKTKSFGGIANHDNNSSDLHEFYENRDCELVIDTVTSFIFELCRHLSNIDMTSQNEYKKTNNPD